MITIPKHTIPTYNPSSTAINEQSDFTRRVPAYSPKVLARVEKIIKQLIQAHDVEENPEKMKDIFFKKASLLPNPTYWELLQLKPDFDYKAIEAECEKIYGIK